ncbi:MAG TPA: proteasome activator, partial [Propionibacteriaceae bacterium]|nr:proteasome activator [Propionibacteriaceae bacterium]
MSDPRSHSEPTLVGTDQEGRVFVLTPADPPADAPVGPEDDPVSEFVEEPAKVMRIGRMISKLLEEVKDAPLDDASRTRLGQIYDTSVTELKGGLAPELADELARLT